MHAAANRRLTLRAVAGFVAIGALLQSSLHAYNAQTSPLWPSGNITINIQLGEFNRGALFDGSTSWHEPIEAAMAEWNQHLGATQLVAVRNGTAPVARLNGSNTITFGDTVFGDAWTGRTIAYSLYWWNNGRRIETDIVFKTPTDWNSYRGTTRGTTYDMRRFALHELGHSLGLDHPNDIGQSIWAVMNGIVEADALQPDDIEGIRRQYANNLPAITAQPASVTALLGGSATFTVAAIGVPAPTYQWRRNGTAITGATSASYTIPSVTASDVATYSVVVTNSAGTITSSNATLTLGTALAIVTQPTNQTAQPGGSATFRVTTNGSGTISYQWRRNGTPIPGATASTYTVSNATTADAGSYSVVVTTSLGTVTSNNATLTVSALPIIVTSPATQTVLAGAPVTISATVTSAGATSYQWRRNGVPIAAATNLSLQFTSVGIDDGGTYTLVATNSAGATESVGAVLTVNWSRLTNLSVRTTAGAGSEVLIAGFVVGGSGPKDLLVRAIGPALQAFGVTGSLTDPRLEIYDGPAVVSTNDNWGGGDALSSAFARVGAFGLPVSSRDAASVISLPAKNYTVQISGVAGVTGIALAELYDAANTSPARLTNVSVRAQVNVGSGVLIAGVSISGTIPKTVLIRAVGPTLSTFGVAGALTDPRVEVFANGGARINENNDWGGTTLLAQTFAAVGAFALPANSRDAALRVTLNPGAYTAQVSGVNNTTGIALVEIYEVP